MDQTINDRINTIMEREMLSQAAFAEKLEINRATLNHILRGRNNPGVQIIEKLISSFPKYNVEWIISGKGEILKTPYLQPDLFQIEPSEEEQGVPNESFSMKLLEITQKFSNLSESVQNLSATIKEEQNANKKSERRISKIYVYYSDNSFEVFTSTDAQ